MMAQEEDKVLMLESIRLAFTENKQDLRTSLTATIDYILDHMFISMATSLMC